MRLVLLLTTMLMAVPATAAAEAEAGSFGSCPKSFKKHEVKMPAQCPPCDVTDPKCTCSPPSVLWAVCLKGSQENGLFLVRSTNRKNRKGRVTSRGRYKDGVPVGKHVTFYANSRRASRFYYDKKGITGKWREWHVNGKLSGRGAFKDGVRVGDSEFFHSNGKRMSVRDESGLIIYFLDDGQEFSRFIAQDDQPISFVKCSKGNKRIHVGWTVTCVNPDGVNVGRYAHVVWRSGRKQPIEVGEYVDGKKTSIRRFHNAYFRSEYTSKSRPRPY